MKLGVKLPLAISSLLLVMACSSGFGLWRMDRAASAELGGLEASLRWDRASRDLASHFKSQTQEWKNVLLRSRDLEPREKHLAALHKLQDEVAREAEALVRALPEGEARALVLKFAQADVALDAAYAKAYSAFEASGFDPAVGDRGVQGLDREPSRLLEDASRRIAAAVDGRAAQARAARGDALLQSIGLMLAALVAGLAGAVLLGRGLLRAIGADPAEVAATVRRLAAGDLATPVVAPAGDTTSVVSLIGQMQRSLAEVVASVRRNSQSVATASAQIAQGNQDLSSRTEQQASALQQTAATMDQLGSTVRNNADSANQANRLARDASDVAAEGGAVVDRVVATMQGINESSRRISEIIGVIDGIAFQTNILALNAAVEAARAGEQGRGFAVVASEVRSLAQRSAEAAKEIKRLIGCSVEQVEQGTTLVDQAGRTMGTIVASIRRVSDIVAEISLASAEQSTGVQQVGQTVTQMDQATQQNAALVEQSAAAAESLKAQAQQLVEAMNTFRLAAGQ